MEVRGDFVDGAPPKRHPDDGEDDERASDGVNGVVGEEDDRAGGGGGKHGGPLERVAVHCSAVVNNGLVAVVGGGNVEREEKEDERGVVVERRLHADDAKGKVGNGGIQQLAELPVDAMLLQREDGVALEQGILGGAKQPEHHQKVPQVDLQVRHRPPHPRAPKRAARQQPTHHDELALCRAPVHYASILGGPVRNKRHVGTVHDHEAHEPAESHPRKSDGNEKVLDP
mmetsp:Transcript_25998/g.72817  ORF Transcript_25998/g.72817 Transcript_25998/m.72817 type:complete len:228 (-) Transcript_25998:452-1135(-)